MKIAILGGGFTGLTSAYYLKKAGHEVTLFEREEVLGGLASGFKVEGWDWFIERAYHHIFDNDDDIIGFAKETGFPDIFFTSAQTSSLYEVAPEEYKILPLDTPTDLLQFPLLSLPERLRAGAALAFLKYLPFFSFYEKESAASFLRKTMGGHAYGVLFGELFWKKFGNYAENIVASFIWTRVHKRSKKLGYIKGGFQMFLNYLEEKLKQDGVNIQKGTAIETMKKIGDEFILSHKDKNSTVEQSTYDVVLSTLPTPVLTKVGKEILPADYVERLSKMKYLNAACLILESTEKLLQDVYWLNVCVKGLPMMVMIQHTNMIPAEHYGGKQLLYIANYIDKDHPLLKMDDEQALEFYRPHFSKLNPVFHQSITRRFYFKAPFAQPIFDAEFVKIKPTFETPVKNFFIANLDMTYPNDRGTNYAVQLGKEVTKYI